MIIFSLIEVGMHVEQGEQMRMIFLISHSGACSQYLCSFGAFFWLSMLKNQYGNVQCLVFQSAPGFTAVPEAACCPV